MARYILNYLRHTYYPCVRFQLIFLLLIAANQYVTYLYVWLSCVFARKKEAAKGRKWWSLQESKEAINAR